MSDQNTLDNFLQPFTPAVRDATLAIRKLVLEVMPDTIEQFDAPAKLIGYGTDHTYRGAVCAVTLHKSYVNLMFARGAELPDPQNLLTGTGKKARHIKVIPGESVNEAAIRQLLREASSLHETS